ncbi:MAG: VanZ family protein [Gemmataceae bacterium]
MEQDDTNQRQIKRPPPVLPQYRVERLGANPNIPPHTPEPKAVRPPLPRQLFLIAALGFTLFAIYGSLVPLNYRPMEFAEAWTSFWEVFSRPVVFHSRSDLAANVLLFVPVAFFWLGTFALDAPRQVGWIAAFFVLPAMPLVGAVIEFSQFWFPPRVVSLNDVVAQTFGGMIGIGLWLTLGQQLTDFLRDFLGTRDRAKFVDRLILAYVLGFILFSGFPYDIAISPYELWSKYRHHDRIILNPFHMPSLDHTSSYLLAGYSILLDVVLFLPVGMLTTRFLLPPGQQVRSFWSAVGYGISLVFLIEIGQLFVWSRFTTTSDLLLGSAGVILGVALTHYLVKTNFAERVLPTLGNKNRTWLWGLMAMGYVAFLCMKSWAPFDFQFDLGWGWERLRSVLTRPPLSVMHSGREAHGLTQLFFRITMLLPLGALFALGFAQRLACSNRVTIALGGLVGLTLAVLLEGGQLFLPTRTPDMTELLFYALGAALGTWIVLRILDQTIENYTPDPSVSQKG